MVASPIVCSSELKQRFRVPTYPVISHKINITGVLLSKIDMHKMDTSNECYNIHSGVPVCLSVYLWWFNKYQGSVRNTWKSRGI